jgi:hypothetical protein
VRVHDRLELTALSMQTMDAEWMHSQTRNRVSKSACLLCAVTSHLPQQVSSAGDSTAKHTSGQQINVLAGLGNGR